MEIGTATDRKTREETKTIKTVNKKMTHSNSNAVWFDNLKHRQRSLASDANPNVIDDDKMTVYANRYDHRDADGDGDGCR